jgi:hypothetical protein
MKRNSSAKNRIVINVRKSLVQATEEVGVAVEDVVVEEATAEISKIPMSLRNLKRLSLRKPKFS